MKNWAPQKFVPSQVKSEIQIQENLFGKKHKNSAICKIKVLWKFYATLKNHLKDSKSLSIDLVWTYKFMRIDASVKFSVHDQSVCSQFKSSTAKPPQPEYIFPSMTSY